MKRRNFLKLGLVLCTPLSINLMATENLKYIEVTQEGDKVMAVYTKGDIKAEELISDYCKSKKDINITYISKEEFVSNNVNCRSVEYIKTENNTLIVTDFKDM